MQPDGGILIGGRFTLVNGTRRDGLARLTADRALDPSFAPPLASSYGWTFSRGHALAVAPDGKSIWVVESDDRLYQTMQKLSG